MTPIVYAKGDSEDTGEQSAVRNPSRNHDSYLQLTTLGVPISMFSIAHLFKHRYGNYAI